MIYLVVDQCRLVVHVIMVQMRLAFGVIEMAERNKSKPFVGRIIPNRVLPVSVTQIGARLDHFFPWEILF
jgi:hypothetical protein